MFPAGKGKLVMETIMSNNCVIEIEGLTKSFSEKKVLDHVNMTIEKGTICGLVGRNGSGKTVLMKCICGFMKADEGRIVISGKEVDIHNKVADNIGIIIETPGFLEEESARNNLRYLASFNHKINRKQIDEAIRLVGLDPADKKRVKRYSLGMRQRLAIAQAIMEKQDILILDEPMNGLDRSGVEMIRELLLDMKRQGKTILMASHYMEDIDYLCDKVYRITDGQVEMIL